VGLDSGLCLQGHTKWVGDFSTFVGVYKDDNTTKNPKSHVLQLEEDLTFAINFVV